MSDEKLDDFLGVKPAPRWRRWVKWALIAAGFALIALTLVRCFGGDAEVQYATAPVRRTLESWAVETEARAATAEAAREALVSRLQATMMPLIATVQERRDAANRAIDSPEEYRRIAQSCGVDHMRLLDRLRNP